MDHEPTAGKEGAAQLRRVLVVDDEYGPRESIAYTLATSFSVETAGGAVAGVCQLRDHPSPVVVLDTRAPKKDGIKALEELRKKHPHVPPIIPTGDGIPPTPHQAIAPGANQD